MHLPEINACEERSFQWWICGLAALIILTAGSFWKCVILGGLFMWESLVLFFYTRTLSVVFGLPNCMWANCAAYQLSVFPRTSSLSLRTRFLTSWCMRAPKAGCTGTDAGFSALLLTRNSLICCALPPYPFLVQGGSRCLRHYLWGLSDYSCFYQYPSKYCLKTKYILPMCHFTAHHTALYCWVTRSPGPWPLESSHSPLRNFTSKSLTFLADYCS